MFRFTNSGDITSAKDIAFKVGKTRRLLMRYVCMNNALQTLATTGLGTAQIIRDGKPIVNLNLAEQAKFNDLRYGNVLRASAAGGAVDMNIIVDFSFMDDGNVLPLLDTDYISIPAISTVTIASGTVTVYQDIEDGSFLYVPKIYTRTETLSAEKPIFVPDANLYLFMFSEPGTPPTKIILSIDGKLRSDTPYAVTEIVTNADWRIEAGTLDFSVIPIGKLATVRGHSYELQMVGGAGTLTYTTVAVDYVPTLSDAVTAAAGGDTQANLNAAVQVTPGVRRSPPRPRPPYVQITPGVVVD